MKTPKSIQRLQNRVADTFLKPLPFIALLLAAPGVPVCSHGAVLVHDDWDDGSRFETNLPEESAWYANVVAGTPSLSTSAGALMGNILMFGTNAGSRLWITHFTPAGSPAELAVGETLKATLVFTPSNVTASTTTSRGLRIGLFNFSEPGAARVSGDGFSTGSGGGAPGQNVTGYMLNMNFAQPFTINNPLQIMKRTDLATNNLMGASAVYTALTSGGGPAGSPGFANDRPYTLEFAVTRFDGSVEITAKVSDNEGWSIAHTATDLTDPYTRFDGFALRPNAVVDVAESLTFSRFTVEVLPFEVRVQSLEPLGLEGMRITWQALPGKTYEVQWNDPLTQSNWRPLGTVTAMERTANLTDSDAAFEPQRFYRVVELP
jgi:hypothetical protein